MEHGYAKLVHGPENFVGILHALGVPAPALMGWATILVELVGGLAVLAGAFVPLVAVPMAAVLLVAMFTVHLPNGFSSIKLLAVTAAGAQFGQPGYETDLLYLACLAALVLGGSGPLAIDKCTVGSSGFQSTATLAMLGINCLSSCSRLPATSGASRLTPVTLPPGLARVATNPTATGLLLSVTIGMVFVCCSAARVACDPPQTMISTLRAINSAARPSNWPASPAR